MLTKKQRLTKKEFDHVFKNGKRLHSPVLQLIYQPGEQFRGAAVVGKKVYKKAVDRNRVRRRLYNVLYRYQKTQGCTGTFVLIAKPLVTELSAKACTRATLEVLAQTQMLRH